MKTPREILLNRHTSATPKLDAIREQVIADECEVTIGNPFLRSGATEGRRQSAIGNPSAFWRAWLWPHPKAWAGLAAVWVVIFGLQLAARDAAPALAQSSATLSPQAVATLQEQRRLLAELIDQSAPVEAAPRKSFPPRPRSEARREILDA